MIALSIDPVNTAFDLVFAWLAYASGYGKLMWDAARANGWGFRRPKAMGFVQPEHELK